MVYRIFVEKKPGLAPEAAGMLADCRTFLGLTALENVRILNRYDVEGIEEALFDASKTTIFSEPQLDNIYAEPCFEGAAAVFAVEPLPGQFDQRADSAAQCIQLQAQVERPAVASAKVYALYGALTEADVIYFRNRIISIKIVKKFSIFT